MDGIVGIGGLFAADLGVLGAVAEDTGFSDSPVMDNLRTWASTGKDASVASTTDPRRGLVPLPDMLGERGASVAEIIDALRVVTSLSNDASSAVTTDPRRALGALPSASGGRIDDLRALGVESAGATEEPLRVRGVDTGAVAGLEVAMLARGVVEELSVDE